MNNMYGRSHSLTLGQFFAGMAFVLTLGAMFAFGARSCISQADEAEAEARSWSTKMGIVDPKVSCASRDTDGDGYVSCSVSSKLPTGQVEIIPVECAGVFTLNDGCRSPKMMVRRAQ